MFRNGLNKNKKKTKKKETEMKQKFLVIMAALLVVFTGVYANAYATTLGFDGTESLKFTFDVTLKTNADGTVYIDGDKPTHVVKIEPFPQPQSNDTVWDMLDLTDRNWAIYQDDTPEGNDFTVNDIFKWPIHLKGFLENGDNSLALDLSFIFEDVENPNAQMPPWSSDGNGMMFTEEFGDYNFDFVTSLEPENECSGKLVVTATNFNPVPEPTTILLFSLGLLGVAGISRKKS